MQFAGRGGTITGAISELTPTQHVVSLSSRLNLLRLPWLSDSTSRPCTWFSPISHLPLSPSRLFLSFKIFMQITRIIQTVPKSNQVTRSWFLAFFLFLKNRLSALQMFIEYTFVKTNSLPPSLTIEVTSSSSSFILTSPPSLLFPSPTKMNGIHHEYCVPTRYEQQ